MADADRRQRVAQPATRGRTARGAGPARSERAAFGGRGPSPEAALLARERRRELLAAVERLREEDRLMIACRFFLDLSERESARVLGWRLGTVKSRLSRALGRLQRELGEEAG
jgi:RNA polymerase sigma factor (sigma-70 family)